MQLKDGPEMTLLLRLGVGTGVLRRGAGIGCFILCISTGSRMSVDPGVACLMKFILAELGSANATTCPLGKYMVS